jgi:hypothetical protein
MGTAFDLAEFDRFVDEQGIPMRIIRKRSPWIAKRLEGHVLRLEEVGTPGDLRTKEEAGAEVSYLSGARRPPHQPSYTLGAGSGRRLAADNPASLSESWSTSRS